MHDCSLLAVIIRRDEHRVVTAVMHTGSAYW